MPRGFARDLPEWLVELMDRARFEVSAGAMLAGRVTARYVDLRSGVATRLGLCDPALLRALTMYSDVIADADEMLTANRRVRSQSERLRAYTNALLLKYRAHHFPRLCGGSDESTDIADRVAMIRSTIRSGALPRPADTPEKCWVGKGTMRPCSGCGAAIVADKLEYELDIVGSGTLLFDAKCLAAWNEGRAERMTA